MYGGVPKSHIGVQIIEKDMVDSGSFWKLLATLSQSSLSYGIYVNGFI